MKKQIGSFNTIGDDGREYMIYIFIEIIDTGSLTDPGATIKGLKEFQTSDGQLVNWLQKGEYEIVETGVILHSNSPDSP